MRLRSLPKVNVEFGLVALAHNLQNIAKIKDNKQKTENKLSLKEIFTPYCRIEIYPGIIAA
jgi:hypothetical protein